MLSLQNVVILGLKKDFTNSQNGAKLHRRIGAHLRKSSNMFDDLFSFPDSDSPTDRGGALAALFPSRGSLLPPPARGLLPGCSGQTQENL